MGLVQCYIAASLDGYIADPSGGVDWLERFQGGDDNYGYEEFFSRLGAIVVGATTYEQIPDLGGWPYGEVPGWVFTHRELPVWHGADVRFAGGSPAEVLGEIQREVDGNVWLVGGADLVRQFVDAGLLDELILFVVPLLLGSGIPLFRDTARVDAELIEAQARGFGLVELRYKLPRGGSS
jgi:dihydrofolate reductase